MYRYRENRPVRLLAETCSKYYAGDPNTVKLLDNKARSSLLTVAVDLHRRQYRLRPQNIKRGNVENLCCQRRPASKK